MPPTNEDRMPALDLVRGAAIFGILLANIPYFIGPDEPAGLRPGDLSWPDRTVSALTLFFVDLKFITLFSLLFGAGLALQIDRAAAEGRPFVRYYLDRQGLLFLIGLCHGLFLWSGDILTTYGVVGVVALYALRAQRRTTVGVMVASYGWAYAVLLMLAVGCVILLLLPPETLRSLAEAGGGGRELESGSLEERLRQFLSRENELLIFQQGRFGEMVLFRAMDLLTTMVQVIAALGWYVLGCFLLGGLLMRHGVFRDPAAHRRLTGRMILVGLAVGVPCHLAAVAMYFIGGEKNALDVNPVDALSFLFNAAGALAQGLAYLGLLLRWSESGRLPWLQARFRAVGRMALTNYLLQSVLCGLVFYGYGLGLFGRVGRAEALLVVAAVWVFEMVLSSVWLRFFTMGPVEWLWRGLASRRFKPLLRSAGEAA